MTLTTEKFNRLKSSLVLKQQESVQNNPENPKGYFQRVWEGYKNAGQEITDVVTDKEGRLSSAINEANMARDRGDLGGAIKGIGKTGLEMGRVGLRSAGAVASTVYNPIIEAPGIKQGLEAVGEQVTKIPGVKETVLALGNLAQKYPNAAKDIQNIIDIAVVTGGAKGEKVIQDAARKSALGVTEKGFTGIEKTGTALKRLGEKAYGISIPLQESTKIAVQNYNKVHPTLAGRVFGMFSNATYTQEGIRKAVRPITEAQTAARQGLKGTERILGEQAANVSDKIFRGTISPKLAQAKQAIDMRSLIKNLEAKVNKISELGRKTDLRDALNTFKNEYKNVNFISGTKLQEYKEGWAKFIAEKSSYKGGKPIGGAYKEIQNMAAQEARPILYRLIGKDGMQAYIDYGNLKSISEFARKTMDPLRSKGITKQAWELILDTGVTPIATVGGQILYKTGEGLEFIGKRGAKTIRNIISSKNTIEQIIEQKGGWKPGMRATFDKALFEKNAMEVKRLLPEVPAEYKQRFANEIKNIMSKPK